MAVQMRLNANPSERREELAVIQKIMRPIVAWLFAVMSAFWSAGIATPFTAVVRRCSALLTQSVPPRQESADPEK